jgi:hypothetical protein
MAIILDPSLGLVDTGTQALGYPAGTTEQRPQNPSNGFTRYNTDLRAMEAYINGAWAVTSVGTYVADALIIAGGGGGGGGAIWPGGGGGAGGLLYITGNTILAGSTYSVVIGSGGAAGLNSQPAYGSNGTNSSFNGSTAIGGGFGDGQNVLTRASTGGNGGSGGGGASYQGTANVVNMGGVGTLNQGNAGGNGYYQNDTSMNSGGGGGAGSRGASYVFGQSGSGGVGLQYGISGTVTYYAGGGGGGGTLSSYPARAGFGGLGGGGNGGYDTVGVAGTVNTGGGGGGGGYSLRGGAGGSGLVIISYFGPQRARGGTITSNAGYTIHTFTSSDTFIG